MLHTYAPRVCNRGENIDWKQYHYNFHVSNENMGIGIERRFINVGTVSSIRSGEPYIRGRLFLALQLLSSVTLGVSQHLPVRHFSYPQGEGASL